VRHLGEFKEGIVKLRFRTKWEILCEKSRKVLEFRTQKKRCQKKGKREGRSELGNRGKREGGGNRGGGGGYLQMGAQGEQTGRGRIFKRHLISAGGGGGVSLEDRSV